jgi:hypothetical protein
LIPNARDDAAAMSLIGFIGGVPEFGVGGTPKDISLRTAAA